MIQLANTHQPTCKTKSTVRQTRRTRHSMASNTSPVRHTSKQAAGPAFMRLAGHAWLQPAYHLGCSLPTLPSISRAESRATGASATRNETGSFSHRALRRRQYQLPPAPATKPMASVIHTYFQPSSILVSAGASCSIKTTERTAVNSPQMSMRIIGGALVSGS